MTAAIESSWAVLSRHFFGSFFRLSFLDDAGEESFKRAIAGILAGVIAFGLFLARVYASKYARLGAMPTPFEYRAMLLADQLLMICLVMLPVMLVMALVSHSVFPDESDFRILMPLPLSGRVIFAAKATPLCLFASVFVAAASFGIGMPFTLVSGGRWAERTWVHRAVVQAITGALAAVFAIVAVIAVHGVIVLLAPRSRLRQILVALQTATI